MVDYDAWNEAVGGTCVAFATPHACDVYLSSPGYVTLTANYPVEWTTEGVPPYLGTAVAWIEVLGLTEVTATRVSP